MENIETSGKKLSLWQVTIIGIAYMTPMTVFDTFGIVSGITNGHVPLAYLLALSAMLLTAWSYARFSRNSEKSGSAYSYTSESLGPKSGFFVGWCSLLDYLLLPLINVLLAAIYLTALIPSVPYWAWVMVSAGLVTLVNCFRIKILANLSLVFVFAPIILMVVFVYLVIQGISSQQSYQHILTLTPLWHGQQDILPLIAGASVLCFSFLGFDAVTTLSNETKNPTKTIPRAVILTTLTGGAIFFTASWFIQLYFPSNIQFKNPDEALPEIVLYVGGALFQSIFLCGQIMNTVASGLASHASASRLLHIMGRDNIFPKKYFGSMHASLGTPFFSVLFVGLISLSAMFLDLAQVISLISFGALVAFTAVNFSVFVKFYIRDKQRDGFRNKFLNLFLPLLSVICILCLWINLDSSSLTFGCFWLAIGILLFVYKLLKKQNIAISSAY
ncbi:MULTISPECIES: APC family permease [unclassified Acinetobacter]|uniref:APC family permease n=1 Tax=unclassified Acinetobacter TaxID=196816 RepID=UPI0025774D79|nr:MULTISPECIES: APC family permease [unclassified Acinetobacter]MDM1764294.1 APC family permease [Acinetobacter sp. 226-1]MDM1767809.1 APC family permease [Acinetobacter sp. 226-4]